ncbi:uncharacterized protein HaLaN_02253, partial [Haematococcus lacustris]
MDSMRAVWVPGWEDRIQQKLVGTAIGVTTASSVNALRLGKDVLYHVPPITAGYTIAMSLFCVFQESLRSVRGGRHDALNSGLAGAAAASISVKVLQG